MQDNNDNINKDFHKEGHDFIKEQVGSSMRSFEAEPPAGLWNQIETGVNKRNKRIVFIRYSAIAASLLLLLSVSVTYLNRDHQAGIRNTPVAQKSTDSQKSTRSIKNAVPPQEATSSISEQSIKSPARSNTRALNTASLQKKQGQSTQRKLIPAQSQASDIYGLQPSDAVPTEPAIKPVTIKEELAETPVLSPEVPALSPEDATNELVVAPVVTPVDVKTALAEIPVDPVVTVPEKLKSSKHWSLALGYGITSGTDLTQNQEAFSRGDGNQYSYDDFSASLANQTLFFEEIENVDHDAPLALGVTIDLPVGSRLNFETGLLYTRLGYRVKTDIINYSYSEYRNEFYYLGIPLGARYSFLKREKFDLYALQWVVTEKGIAGRYSIDTYKNDEIRNTESKHSSIQGVQLSSVTGLGGAIKISGNLSLFAQGGLQVFFLNGTQPYNIRSNHVAWPSFQAGLRIGFNKR